MKTVRFRGRAAWCVSVLLLAAATPAQSQSIAVDPQPVRTLAGATRDGAPVFGVVAGATRLRDGTIVIGDQSANALKFFDGQGRLTATVGRQGEGPGEFRMLGWVKPCRPDSLFVFDVFPRRISVFSASGHFVRQFQVPAMPAQVACSREGVFAALSGQATQPPEGVDRWHATAPLLIVDAMGVVTHQLGSVPAYEIAQVGRGWFPPPGGSHASIAVTRRRVLVCPLDSGAVGAFSLAGARLGSIPLRVPPHPPSRGDLERATDALLAYMPAGDVRDTMRQRLLRLPPPANALPCNDILTDPADNLWVVLSAPGDSVTTLRVFGPDDRVLGDVSVPAALEVYEIGSDYLLASGETPEGEPWVRMYRVRRSPAR